MPVTLSFAFAPFSVRLLLFLFPCFTVCVRRILCLSGRENQDGALIVVMISLGRKNGFNVKTTHTIDIPNAIG